MVYIRHQKSNYILEQMTMEILCKKDDSETCYDLSAILVGILSNNGES